MWHVNQIVTLYNFRKVSTCVEINSSLSGSKVIGLFPMASFRRLSLTAIDLFCVRQADFLFHHFISGRQSHCIEESNINLLLQHSKSNNSIVLSLDLVWLRLPRSVHTVKNMERHTYSQPINVQPEHNR